MMYNKVIKQYIKVNGDEVATYPRDHKDFIKIY